MEQKINRIDRTTELDGTHAGSHVPVLVLRSILKMFDIFIEGY